MLRDMHERYKCSVDPDHFVQVDAGEGEVPEVEIRIGREFVVLSPEDAVALAHTLIEVGGYWLD